MPYVSVKSEPAFRNLSYDTASCVADFVLVVDQVPLGLKIVWPGHIDAELAPEEREQLLVHDRRVPISSSTATSCHCNSRWRMNASSFPSMSSNQQLASHGDARPSTKYTPSPRSFLIVKSSPKESHFCRMR